MSTVDWLYIKAYEYYSSTIVTKSCEKHNIERINAENSLSFALSEQEYVTTLRSLQRHSCRILVGKAVIFAFNCSLSIIMSDSN